LINAALAMSTMSLRPSTLAWGAGCSVSTAASSACAGLWPEGQMAQPT